jgi:hypothetical protein
MRASTSASQARGSTSFSFAVTISEYIAAARSPPASDPANSHDFLPRAIPRNARCTARSMSVASLRLWHLRPHEGAIVRRNTQLIQPSSRAARDLKLGAACSCDTSRALGGRAVFSARLGVCCEPQAQHVHAHRARHRCGLCLQPCRCAAARFLPGGLPHHGRHRTVYFEAAAVITVLVLLGKVLELRAREQTGGAIRALLN